ncbi:hypothetical protein BN2475_250133 [Paraburkholderia ribeironis]|uniref:Uncharacterized protein n=1 Tax=Paraburkholderia ribeironis TaxID=1247936 RepID=A0A1N7RZ11_9BURK|nr:hypothetical protein BN2475_250133 [Paraburkholderia ribeironis]
MRCKPIHLKWRNTGIAPPWSVYLPLKNTIIPRFLDSRRPPATHWKYGFRASLKPTRTDAIQIRRDQLVHTCRKATRLTLPFHV